MLVVYMVVCVVYMVVYMMYMVMYKIAIWWWCASRSATEWSPISTDSGGSQPTGSQHHFR